MKVNLKAWAKVWFGHFQCNRLWPQKLLKASPPRFHFSHFLLPHVGRGRIKEANYLEESPRVIYGENQNWSPTYLHSSTNIWYTNVDKQIIWDWTAGKRQLMFQNQSIWGVFLITYMTSMRRSCWASKELIFFVQRLKHNCAFVSLSSFVPLFHFV